MLRVLASYRVVSRGTISRVNTKTALKPQKRYLKITAMSQNWNQNLTPEQLLVLRDKHTERPHTGAYLHNKDGGVYHCANCDEPLYKSETKFDSQCGWPSFYQEVRPGAITYHTDNTLGMKRTEICCAKCGGHMGHVFEGEGWKERLGLPEDVRHCVNSASLNFKKN
ncbi:LAMI_0F01178g1_1 [Lachancea mirantina]|uniref:Peptide-methionine (R)-S-oxide reductase n=1 Tax=Lachancea mirantina TaxID=1230905 RepID=A0A1G4JVS0_9SACH|nr:LAMI_0F01178g1_1 [Lachancea mirantina]